MVRMFTVAQVDAERVGPNAGKQGRPDQQARHRAQRREAQVSAAFLIGYGGDDYALGGHKMLPSVDPTRSWSPTASYATARAPSIRMVARRLRLTRS